MRVAVYMRVACANQLEDPFENQENQLRVFARENQMEIASVFRDTGSGISFERPGWKDLMAELSRGNYDGVLAKDMTRIGRNVLPTIAAIEKIEKRGAKIFCVNGEHCMVEPMKESRRKIAHRLKTVKKG